MAINSFNANAGWNALLEANRFGIGLQQKGFRDMLQGVEEAAEGYFENRLYNRIADTVNNGTDEEINALESDIMRNPEAFKQFQVIDEKRQRKKRRELMREGTAIAQSGDRAAFDNFIAANANDSELNEVLLGEWDRSQESAIDQYLGNAFQNPDLKERRSLVEKGFQQFGGSKLYPEKVKATREMMYFDNENPTEGMKDTAKIRELNYIYSLPEDDPRRIAGEIYFGTKSKDPFDLSKDERDDIGKLSAESGTADLKLQKMERILKDLEQTAYMGGVAGSLKRSFQSLTGTPEKDAEIFREVRSIINSEVIKNLPPGAASDPDVVMAKQGFINGFANDKETYSAIRGLMQMYEYEKNYKNEKASWLANNRAYYRYDPEVGRNVTFDEWWSDKTEKEYIAKKDREAEIQAQKDEKILNFMNKAFSQPPKSTIPKAVGQPSVNFLNEPSNLPYGNTQP